MLSSGCTTRRPAQPAVPRAIPAHQPRGFTLIELLVSILVIAILIGILIVAVRQVLIVAKRAGDQQQVAGLQGGINTFQQTFDGEIPPLVYDGEPLRLPSSTSLPRVSGGVSTGPVFRPGGNVPPVVSTFDRIYVDGGATFLNGRPLPSGQNEPPPPLFDPIQDPRYSKFSLPIFLTGTLDESADGVSGPGMRLGYNSRSGWTFGGSAPVRSSFYQPQRDNALATSYASIDEFQEHGQGAGGTLPTSATQASADRAAFVNGAGVAIRYYRWEPFNASDVPAGVDQGPLGFLNLPFVLRDPRDWDAPNEPGARIPTNYRNARYAIVSAGPNGLFGTEPVALIRARLGIGAGVADDQVRYEAWRDNVSVVGEGKR